MRKIKNSNWQNCYHKDYCIDWWARWILWYAALIIAAVLNTINRLQLKIIEQLQSETKLFYTKTSIAEINFSAINLYRRFQFYCSKLHCTLRIPDIVPLSLQSLSSFQRENMYSEIIN